MKLSEIRGERALEVLADIIDPASEIFGDKEIATALRNGEFAKGIKLAIKGHKKAVIELFAAIDGEDPKAYGEKLNILTLPAKALEMLNEPEVLSLFTSPGQTERQSANTSENTTASEE